MRWFTADTHFGHANVVRFCDRPFTDAEGAPVVDAMNRSITQTLIDTVGWNDELWVLGDYAMGNIQSTLHVLDRVHCARKVLVAGNHDRCHPMNRKAGEWMGRYLEVFDEVIVDGWTTADGIPVRVSHFPYAGDSSEQDRHADWRPFLPEGHDEWLLHGHVHDTWRMKNHCINVGVDAWSGRPVSEREIAALIAGGPADLEALLWA